MVPPINGVKKTNKGSGAKFQDKCANCQRRTVTTKRGMKDVRRDCVELTRCEG